MRDELVSLDPDKEVKITNKCEFERRPHSIMMEQDCFLTSASSHILPLLFLWSGVTDQCYGSPQEFPSIYQNDPQDLCFLHIVLYVTVLWLTFSTLVSCWVYLPRPWCWTNIIYRLKSLREAKIAPVRTDHPTVTVHEVGSWYGNHTEYDATYQPVSSFLSPPPQQLRGPITQRIPAQFLLLRLVVLSALTVIDKLSQPNDGAAKRPLERKL